MYIYYPTQAQTYIRQVGGPNAITEQWIGYGPDQVIVISGSFPPTASTAFISASYAITYTTSMSLATSASYSNTSSFSLNAGLSPTSSYSVTASYLNAFVNTFGTTGSFHPINSLSQGSCLLWVSAASGTYFDSYAQYSASTNHDQVRFIKDLSGNSRHIRTPEGSFPGLTKYALITNTGEKANKSSIWCEWVNGCSLQYSTIAAPTYPLWMFCVAKLASGSVQTAAAFDGVASSNRMLCQVGTTIQLYAGAALVVAITGSVTGSILNHWFLQSFKNTAGGNNSYVNTNGTQSAFGNCGGQTLTGFSFGSDYLGNSNAINIAELMLFSNITDADAASIEAYLKG